MFVFYRTEQLCRWKQKIVQWTGLSIKTEWDLQLCVRLNTNLKLIKCRVVKEQGTRNIKCSENWRAEKESWVDFSLVWMCLQEIKLPHLLVYRDKVKQHLKGPTVVSSQECIAVFVLELSIHILLRLLDGDVHVSIQTGQDPCRNTAGQRVVTPPQGKCSTKTKQRAGRRDTLPL